MGKRQQAQADLVKQDMRGGRKCEFCVVSGPRTFSLHRHAQCVTDYVRSRVHGARVRDFQHTY
jgi:hypothetical protein